MSVSTEASLRLASSSVFCRRCKWPDCSRTNCLRERSRARIAWVIASGTKLGRTSPWASRSASQAASATSVLRPGTFFTCAALARISTRSPSDSTCQTGLQYTHRDAAELEALVSSVVVTDPGRPLFGQALKLLSLRCSRGPGFLALSLPDGRRRLVPRAATDLDRPLASAVALPRISVRTLLPLARRIRSMLAASCTEACHADTLPSPGPPAATTVAATASTAAMADAAYDSARATGPAPRPRAGAHAARGGAAC